MKNSTLWYLLAWFFVILGFVTIIGFLFELHGDGWSFFGGHMDLDKTNDVGSFIGGFVGTLFSLSGFILIYLTLKEQRSTFQYERFETKFFELLDFHRSNVSELEYKKCEIKEGDEYIFKGRQVFKIIYDQINEVLTETSIFYVLKNHTCEEIYNQEYLKKLRANKYILARNVDMIELAHINIAFLIVFFGLGNEGFLTIKSLLKTRYNKGFVEPLLNFIKLKPVVTSKNFELWNSINALPDNEKFELAIIFSENANKKDLVIPSSKQTITLYGNKYFKYYGGHQFRLGQYFRHLYQLVNFVNDQTFLSEKQKYNNMKILRAQLSSYELLVLFFNSISILGNDWEYRIESTNDFSTPFITKYQLIKNIVGDETSSLINLKKYYPGLDYTI
jgi:hypothetical protein